MKPYKEAILSETLVENRGKRGIIGKRVPERGSAIKKFPERVLNLKNDPPTIKRDDNGNFLLDEAACVTAAKNMRSDSRFGERSTYGAFSMMANVQPRDSKAKVAFTKCRDWAFCALHKATLTSLKKKLDETSGTSPRANELKSDIAMKSNLLKKKYPGCV